MNDVAQSMMEDRRTRAGLGCKRYRCSKLGLGRCPAAFSESMGRAMLWVLLAGVGAQTDGQQPHDAHQAAGTAAAMWNPLLGK